MKPNRAPQAGPLTRRLIPQPDGSTLTTFEVEINKLPYPDRTFVADSASISETDDGLALGFYQWKTDRSAPRALVQVRITQEALQGFRSSSAKYWDELRSFVLRNGSIVPPDPVPVEPRQVVVLRSNVISSAYTGRQGEMLFYQISPMAVHLSRSKGSGGLPEVQAVVSIDLPTANLAGVVERLMEGKLLEDWK